MTGITFKPAQGQRAITPFTLASCPGCGQMFQGDNKVTLQCVGDTIETTCCGTYSVGLDSASSIPVLMHVAGASNPKRAQALSWVREQFDNGEFVLPERAKHEPLHVHIFGEKFTVGLVKERDFPEECVGRPDLNVLGDKSPWIVLRDGHEPELFPTTQRKLERRVCRWCAGDGLDRMLPNRVLHIFRQALPYQNTMRSYGIGGMAGDILVVPQVSAWFPLNRWTEEMATTGYDPWPSIRRKREDVACKRCGGSGDASPEIAPPAARSDSNRKETE